MKIRYRFAAGFTLLEVLIALVVLAIAMTALYLASSGITQINGRLEDKTIASWVALNVIAKARIGLITPSTGENALQGQELMFQRQWAWHVSRYKTPDKNTSKIKVAVGSPNQQPVIEMIGYLKEVPDVLR